MKKRAVKKGRPKNSYLRGMVASAPSLVLFIAGAIFAAAFFLHESLPMLQPPQEPERLSAVTPGLPAVDRMPAAPADDEPKIPRLAIVIDDVGLNMAPVKKLMELGIPLTFAVLPRQRYSKELANVINEAGFEVIIHMPMEPENALLNDPGKGALMLSQSEEEIRRAVRKMISETPHAVGTSNHMGSRFTKDYSKMRIVLEEVKNSGLYFLDSRTTAESVAFKLAREMGVKYSTRKVFLDNELDTEAIKDELRRAIRIALSKGEAVAIGHPHRQTIKALSQMKETIESAGIKLVLASNLVR
jgi:polysaccharide deacetylase 2 family uncharacterized protein YibQ